ncbi:FAD-binding oxidoreductase [Thalassobacter stenotrophicus]|uniref:D-lactate dehydrogenase (cytochrome) n=2 Tax=Thalassobacter stenotrophicus TaxID=266809 RepID=A0A0P1F158_9RHOB|nr:FAD-linked oxidase C-terminal domain-containing protein [Thalassobacter stenotrophicus]PVZ48239.1 FAD-binding protein [Thalassobacter stenotrophicus]CUH61127.1 putative FAD-linked oxidoreductase [Thalassobacter stenotrophicus]SHI57575.1 D-lactate dehydrogenase (cytochrome) [Thalassobacter stenotrophicus DSM 16310]
MLSEAARTQLSQTLGDRLSLSKSDLALHGRSETHFPTLPPDAVAYPETAEEVSAIMRTCSAHGVPVIGWGTGTGLEGHTSAVRGGVSVDFSRMNKVLDIHSEDMDVVIQPGVTREQLNEELRATGLFFPVDPGANASLGGMASTRASGTTAVRYGTMRDNVRGLEVVLADGRIIRTGTRARKSSAGYDLTSLFVGSEGTLGLITELTLRVHGIPEATSAAVCAFDTISGAVDAVIATIQMGIPMARIEFLDAASVAACNARDGAEMPVMPHLMIEFHGSERAVAEDAARFGEIAEEFGAQGYAWSTQPEERRRLWDMRHNAYYAILASRPGATALVTDVCVPISRLAQAVEETVADIADSSIPGPILGHAGDGNFHAILLVEPDNAAELQAAKALSGRMVERALNMGGTATGEHGVGMGKLDYMAREHGAAWDVMSTLKRGLDPDGLMNPGKLVRQN